MFAVPFGYGRHPEPVRLQQPLRRLILEMESSGKAANPRPLTARNAATFESHFDFFRLPDPAVQELKAFCWDQLVTLVGRLNGYDRPAIERLQIFNDCWFHVSRRGGFFSVHNHPNASWSGVYCVDPGRSDADKPDSGLLSFINPMTASAMHMDAGVANIRLPYGSAGPRLRLETGQLVLFPSWVLHEVTPFEGEGERITVAFNCWFSLPNPASSS